jgi:hypothetical protein
VFRREKGTYSYLGAVSNPKLPGLAVAVPTRPSRGRVTGNAGSDAEYEIWLMGDGPSRGIWYSPSRRLWGDLDSTGAPHHDAGLIGHLISVARPTIPEPPRPVSAESTGLWLPPPPTLAALCRQSRIIAVGRVVGVLGYAHNPVQSTECVQHTVYAFAVEQYLKIDTPAGRPVLKVWQNGGPLPWTGPSGVGRAVGWEIAEDPMLNVGDRYILFLKLPEEPGNEWHKLGFVPGRSGGGIYGKIAELDEYIATDHWRGKLLLRNGRTQAPRFLGNPEDHWRFETGPQILDIPEAAAIQTIRLQLAAL